MTVLIPIYNAVIQTRDRRILTPEGLDGWFKHLCNDNMIQGASRRLIWINEFTTGRFYLARDIVAFEDETDFIIFKLWYKELE